MIEQIDQLLRQELKDIRLFFGKYEQIKARIGDVLVKIAHTHIKEYRIDIFPENEIGVMSIEIYYKIHGYSDYKKLNISIKDRIASERDFYYKELAKFIGE